MSKFRSKLKRKTKGKHWAHGQSATSNPQVNKHRLKARSRFFQPNLSLSEYNAANYQDMGNPMNELIILRAYLWIIRAL